MAETTLLEDIETTRRMPRYGSYRQFLDSKAPGAVLASKRFYEKIDGPYSTKFQDLLLECRERAWFIRNDETGHVRIAAKQCRLRWCFHCSEARQQFITQAVYPWYSRAKNPLLLTVTLKHTHDPLPEQIDFLYKSFQKLRNRKICKVAIRGGVWFFQVTYNQKKQEWHPHIHALLDSDYMLHADLVHHWNKITNGSTIVHIRAVNDPEKTLAHNARYAARPSALIKIPESLWPELYNAFNGRRICGTWGTARKISLRPQKPEDANKWKSIGGFKTVIGLVDSDDRAAAIFEAWQLDAVLDEGINMNDIENFINGFEDKPRSPPEWETQDYFDFL